MISRKNIKYFLIKYRLLDGLKDIRKSIETLFRCNIIKTIYYNFRWLPFKQAIRLPIVVGWRTKLKGKGKIVINCRPRLFMIDIGIPTIPCFDVYGSLTFLQIDGRISAGECIKIHPSAKIWVGETGNLSFKGWNVIGNNTKIACFKEITIGEYTGISWESQVFDTNFHYTKDIVSGKILNKDNAVFIGKDVFIGNHVNIAKGSKIPDGSLVSAWSNVSGSFMKNKTSPLIQGPKASVIDNGFYIAQGFKMNQDERYGKIFKKKHSNK